MIKATLLINKYDIRRMLVSSGSFTIGSIVAVNVLPDQYSPILIGALLIFCLSWYVTHLYRRQLASQKYDTSAKDNYQQIEALFNIFSMYTFRYPLPEMRRWAVSPDAILYLLRTAIKQNARSIVECGSGVSTIVLAKYMKENGGGHVFSLDHDEKYAEDTRALLRLHGLESYATVYTAPLAEIIIGSRPYKWYHGEVITALPDNIDMIFVDGPPAPDGSFNRFPALNMLKNKMCQKCTIVMDDVVRADELAISKIWAESMGRSDVTYIDVEKKMAII